MISRHFRSTNQLLGQFVERSSTMGSEQYKIDPESDSPTAGAWDDHDKKQATKTVAADESAESEDESATISADQ